MLVQTLNRTARKLRLLMGLGMLLPASGCTLVAAGAAGGATYAYTKGDSDQTYPYPMDTVWNACLKSLTDSGLAINSASKDQLKGQIDASMINGDRVKVKLSSSGTATLVNLRVNTFGDRTTQTALVEKINVHLGTGQPPLVR